MTGLFFGSFDPPHIGHVNIVTSVLNSKWVDKVIVIPAWKNPWKPDTIPYRYRMQMCIEAFDKIDNVSISSVEGVLLGQAPVPTYKVLDYFEEKYSDDFRVITTPETYLEIPKWQCGEDILNRYKFLVVDSAHFADIDIDLLDGDETLYISDINVCSTDIRRKLREGSIPQPYLQTEVLEYIKRYKLYE